MLVLSIVVGGALSCGHAATDAHGQIDAWMDGWRQLGRRETSCLNAACSSSNWSCLPVAIHIVLFEDSDNPIAGHDLRQPVMCAGAVVLLQHIHTCCTLDSDIGSVKSSLFWHRFGLERPFTFILSC